MKPDKLEEMILKHKAEGRKPFFVNCTAGTTVMGAFDPLHQIADVCQKHHLWMHVDVRYNNFPFATKSHRRWLTSISESLSFQVPLTKQYTIHECFWKKGTFDKENLLTFEVQYHFSGCLGRWTFDEWERKRQTREKDKLPFGMLVSNKRTEFGKQLLFIPK